MPLTPAEWADLGVCYRASSRAARATQGNLVSKTKQAKNTFFFFDMPLFKVKKQSRAPRITPLSEMIIPGFESTCWGKSLCCLLRVCAYGRARKQRRSHWDIVECPVPNHMTAVRGWPGRRGWSKQLSKVCTRRSQLSRPWPPQAWAGLWVQHTRQCALARAAPTREGMI